MKILHVIPSLAAVRGGPNVAVIEIVKSLRNIGVDAEIAATNDNGNILLNVPLNTLCEYEQVPVRFFARFSPPIQAIREFAFSLDLTIWLWQHLCEYDLLHVHGVFSYSTTIAMVIARIKNIPYVIRPNGMLCNWSLRQGSGKKNLYLNLVEKANLNCSSFIEFTALQEQKEAETLNLSADKFIMPYGLCLPERIIDARSRLRHMIQVPEDEPIILFLSRLHHKKGLDFLIPALARLTNQRFTFVLAGNGSPDYQIELKKMLCESKIEHRTYWAGFVQGEMKNILLQGSDIFALTSYSESFGLAVLEAISSGLTIVVTPGVPLSSVVEQNQFGHVPEMEINSIVKALSQSLLDIQDQEQKSSIIDRARQFILENYTWDEIALKMVLAYEQIISNQRPT